MARAESVQTISATAGAAVAIYRFVQLQSDGKFDQVGTANARPDAVSAEAAAADGDTFAVALMSGVMKVTAGAAVSVGAVIGSDNQGRAVTAGTSVGNYQCGVALTAAGAAGQIIEVLLQSPGQHGGAS